MSSGGYVTRNFNNKLLTCTSLPGSYLLCGIKHLRFYEWGFFCNYDEKETCAVSGFRIPQELE
uniref:Uncharacterized protein n=1 Tax=Anguilla anguilla TaxID=7936 RepID=A0A0E9UU57_ANGAN